ncbi:hypothetical protein GE061_017965 [Apolygus lucorum]|uniref:Uncharacterized protein n=1 Tax=Apolygus lucorum TaxID=248454 RepID=A0A8S9XDS9_APOLU|nr:hypothetical protein GE061_017965 [Apolygus lucorum]
MVIGCENNNRKTILTQFPEFTEGAGVLIEQQITFITELDFGSRKNPAGSDNGSLFFPEGILRCITTCTFRDELIGTKYGDSLWRN